MQFCPECKFMTYTKLRTEEDSESVNGLLSYCKNCGWEGELDTDKSTALIALTHDPKIDDPALKHALDKRFYYIGALGSKKTHSNRCDRLKEAGYTHDQINQIHGPIGIKLGGKSASEIALSIISQLVLITNNRRF